jgi:ABC-type multidrug transport system ATPase subunit
LIEIRGLAKTYADGHRALSGIDLEIGEGMFGLLGPNGAGKTTFLSILVLAREPSAGTRIYHGLDAASAANRPEIRRRIGFLPQDFVPIRHLTGFEYLVHCAELREVPLDRRALERRARDLLDAVDLTHAAGRTSGEYSGGMRRRLGIAQAMIHEPKLLVVDEPTAGLDPEERIRFRNLISDVADQTAVLLSTHIVEDIEATCPRIGVIAKGSLLFEGSPAELLQRAVGRLFELPDGLPPPPGATVVGRRVDDDGRPVVTLLSNEPIPEGTPKEPTLEAAYSAFLVDRAGHDPVTGEEAA